MKIDKLFAGLNVSAQGLSAQRRRMNAIATNMANAETTRTEEGKPYQRKVVVMKSSGSQSFAATLRSSAMTLSATSAGHMTASGDIPIATESVPGSVGTDETIDPSPFKMIYDPTHPDADARGYVQMPNVNVVTEMVDMISASRAYEANVTAVNAAKNIAKDALEI